MIHSVWIQLFQAEKYEWKVRTTEREKSKHNLGNIGQVVPFFRMSDISHLKQKQNKLNRYNFWFKKKV
jgi:hypothetical protein